MTGNTGRGFLVWSFAGLKEVPTNISKRFQGGLAEMTVYVVKSISGAGRTKVSVRYSTKQQRCYRVLNQNTKPSCIYSVLKKSMPLCRMVSILLCFIPETI